MQLTTAYSSSCGLKIQEPYIYDVFFPFVEEDFITIDTDNNNYSYWNDVILLIKPYLEVKNITIFQLGHPDSSSISFVNRTNGSLSPSQQAYLLKRSKLHITSNNFSAQFFASLSKPLICLTENKKRALPFSWGNPDFHDFIYPDSHEFIEPERLAKIILEKLEINFNFKYEAIFIGDKYKDGLSFCEMVPTSPLTLQKFNLNNVLVRMDLKFSEEVLTEQLKRGKVSIYTDKPININIIKTFQENIIEVVYEIKEENDPNFCEKVKSLGVPCNLVSFLPTEKINNEKLKYMEINNIIPQIRHSLANIGDIEDQDIDKLFFKTKRYIFKDDVVYLSEESLNQGIKSNNSNELQKVINTSKFWQSLDALTILKKIN